MDTLDPAAHLNRMRRAAPLVHNITNHVAMNPVANILLALGASPAMAHAPEEVEAFARMADALTINIGTLSAPWLDAMVLAARAAGHAGTPWVLDPVAVGVTGFRRSAGAQLLALGPSVVRGNASEILALAGQDSAGRGVDSTDPVEAAEAAAVSLAAEHNIVVALTGPVDRITDGRRLARVAGGDPIMPRVTALGCALSGVVGAFIAGSAEVFDASLAALIAYGVCGEQAAARASGPGSFMPQFVDALYGLTPDVLNRSVRVEFADAS